MPLVDPIDDQRPHLLRLHGRVQRIAVDPVTGQRKGYGFIRTAEGQDYFFHRSELQAEVWRDMREGDSVSFTPVETDKGPKAIDVVVGK